MRTAAKLSFFAFLVLAGCSAAEKNTSTSPPTGASPVTPSVREMNNAYLITDTLNIPVLSPSGGARFYNDSILFLSATKSEQRMIPDHISFGNVEAYYKQVDDTVSRHKIFSEPTRFIYPAEALTFTPDFRTLYFTKIQEGDKKEKIFTAVYDRSTGGWTEESLPLWFCHEGIRYSHPALSADGKRMVFASDMSGGSGKMDLYVTRLESDKWSLPENLGIDINTSGNEFYPFLSKDNTLYFSSDGLKGYGGYDIFISRFNGKSWTTPVNLSVYINSPGDETAFSLNATNETVGVFTKSGKSKTGNPVLCSVRMGPAALADSAGTLAEALFDRGLADPSFRYVFKPEQPVAVVEEKKPEPVVEKVQGPVKPQAEEPVPAIKKAEPETPKPATVSTGDVIVYRVQILSSIKPRGVFSVEVNGVTYKTYEYFYLKEYRSTIGEFSSLRPAVNLQNALRRSGRKEAFVVAFRNNVRTLDMSLFKKPY